MRNLIFQLSVLAILLILAQLSSWINPAWFPYFQMTAFLSWIPQILILFCIIGAIRLRIALAVEVKAFFDKLEPSVQALSKNVLELADESALSHLKGRAVIQSVHQTSEAVAEILSQLQLTEQNTLTASNKSISNLENCQRGSRTIEDLVQRMEKVLLSSKEIQKFTDVLEEIALQTNILALNAAVEAAHAGEHAGGFNVIANSIRELSVKSSEASKQIQKLIKGTSNEIEEAYTQTEATKLAFQSIRISTEEIDGSLNQISAACREQTIGIDQIAVAIQHVESETLMVQQGSERIAKQSKDIGVESDQILISSRALKILLTSDVPPVPSDCLRYLMAKLEARGAMRITTAKSNSQPTIAVGDLDLSENFSILDEVKIRTGGVATVFVFNSITGEFTRISTNILNQDGARAVGTPLAAGKVKDALTDRKSFEGRLEILSKSYECAYQPLVVNDELIGALYFGYLIG